MKAKILNYIVTFKESSEGGYIASVDFLPGCMTQGETLSEVRFNIKDAIEGYLAVLKAGSKKLSKYYHTQ